MGGLAWWSIAHWAQNSLANLKSELGTPKTWFVVRVPLHIMNLHSASTNIANWFYGFDKSQTKEFNFIFETIRTVKIAKCSGALLWSQLCRAGSESVLVNDVKLTHAHCSQTIDFLRLNRAWLADSKHKKIQNLIWFAHFHRKTGTNTNKTKTNQCTLLNCTTGRKFTHIALTELFSQLVLSFS